MAQKTLSNTKLHSKLLSPMNQIENVNGARKIVLTFPADFRCLYKIIESNESNRKCQWRAQNCLDIPSRLSMTLQKNCEVPRQRQSHGRCFVVSYLISLLEHVSRIAIIA